jgi:hypothetical protein
MIYNELNKIIHENGINNKNVLMNEQINNYIISYLIEIPCYNEINNTWCNEDNTDYLALYNLTLTNKKIFKMIHSSLFWNKLKQFIELCKKEKITDTMSYYMIIKNITVADIPYYFYVYNDLNDIFTDKKKSNNIGKCRSYDICSSYLAQFIDISDIIINNDFIKSSFYSGALFNIILNDPKKLNEIKCIAFTSTIDNSKQQEYIKEYFNLTNLNVSESSDVCDSVLTKILDVIDVHKITKHEYILSNNYVVKNAILFSICKINFVIIYNYHSDDVNNDEMIIKYFLSSKSKKINYKTIFDVKITQYDDSVYIPCKITDIKHIMTKFKISDAQIEHYLKLIVLLLRIGFNNKLDFDKLSGYFNEENKLLTKNNKKYYKSYLLDNKILYDLFQNEHESDNHDKETYSNSLSFSEEIIIDNESLLSSVEEDMFTSKDYMFYTNNSLHDILMNTNDNIYTNKNESDIDIDLIDLDLSTKKSPIIIDHIKPTSDPLIIDYDSKDITDDFTVETVNSNSVEENIEYESSSETSEKDVSSSDEESSDTDSSEDIEHISYETSNTNQSDTNQSDTNQSDTNQSDNQPQNNAANIFTNILQGNIDLNSFKVLLLIVFLIIAVLGLVMVICAIGLVAIILMICTILYKHLNQSTENNS